MQVDIGAYAEAYLDDWDRRATVRGQRRYRLTPDAIDKELYPESLLSILGHPAIVARGAETRRRIVVLAACAFQEAIAGIETDLVADLCSRLANEGAGVPVPGAVRQVALTIATDELYHAYVAREFATDIERLTGIPAMASDGSRPPLYAAVTFVRDTAPAGLRRSAETMALCIAEHFVTEELFGVAKDSAPDSPFHFMLREHLIDEGRHQAFFQHLMRHLWETSDDAARVGLGRLIPGFLAAFLDPEFYRRTDGHILDRLGFGLAERERIVGETRMAAATPAAGGKAALPAARHPFRLMRGAGILDHRPTHTLLIESGWLPAESAA
ncbi:diiron oxygenase [soil metagenome]